MKCGTCWFELLKMVRLPQSVRCFFFACQKFEHIHWWLEETYSGNYKWNFNSKNNCTNVQKNVNSPMYTLSYIFKVYKEWQTIKIGKLCTLKCWLFIWLGLIPLKWKSTISYYEDWTKIIVAQFLFSFLVAENIIFSVCVA